MKGKKEFLRDVGCREVVAGGVLEWTHAAPERPTRVKMPAHWSQILHDPWMGWVTGASEHNHRHEWWTILPRSHDEKHKNINIHVGSRLQPTFIGLAYSSNSIAIVLKPYRNSIEILSKFYRNSNEYLSEFKWNSIEILLKFYGNSIEILSKF